MDCMMAMEDFILKYAGTAHTNGLIKYGRMEGGSLVSEVSLMSELVVCSCASICIL